MSYLFDAGGEYITIPGTTLPTTGAVFLLWYPTSNTFNWDQVFISQFSGFNDLWRVGRSANTNLRGLFKIGGGNFGPNATISAPSLNVWHSICFNWTSGGASELFLNNVSVGTASGTSTSAFTNDILIGNISSTGPAMGRIAEVSIYNTILDSTARTSLHGLYVPSKGSNGLHYWPLNGDANDSWGGTNGTVTLATSESHPTMIAGSTNTRLIAEHVKQGYF